MSACRSSVTTPARGLATSAQAATRVTGTIAGAPPSKLTLSFMMRVRRISIISSSNKTIEISLHDGLGLICRKRFAHELHGLRLAQRKGRIAPHQQMLHRYGAGGILKNARFNTDRIKIKPPQIIADGRLQCSR